MKLNRIMLAAGASGSGKTLITCGLLQLLKRKGISLSSFKCGPDYIDPLFHAKVLGTESVNLDTFFSGEDVTKALFAKHAAAAELSVMEGVMGFYDGVAGITTDASAYDLARVTETPVILIVPCKGMSGSIAAIVKGFLEYRQDSNIKGVILNRISPMLYPRIKELIEHELPVKVVGYVPEVSDCVIESRHLGLVLPEEVENLQEKLNLLADVLEKSLDLKEILQIAENAKEYEEKSLVDLRVWSKIKYPVRVAVARDEAFCFLYKDNLQLLEDMGAELVYFSPLKDRQLPPDADGMLLPGGYPELYGVELEKNQEMRQSICSALENGIPCLAECGGFMYLHESMEDMNNRKCEMAGWIKGESFRTKRLQRFGYIRLYQKQAVFGEDDLGPIPAHEFHYFDSTDPGAGFSAKKPQSMRGWECMHVSDHVCAGYPHLYYYGNPKIAEGFLKACCRYREGN